MTSEEIKSNDAYKIRLWTEKHYNCVGDGFSSFDNVCFQHFDFKEIVVSKQGIELWKIQLQRLFWEVRFLLRVEGKLSAYVWRYAIHQGTMWTLNV